MTKRWSDYLWIGELTYLALSFFNIVFAWLGMIFFVTPLLFAIFGKNKNVKIVLFNKKVKIRRE